MPLCATISRTGTANSSTGISSTSTLVPPAGVPSTSCVQEDQKKIHLDFPYVVLSRLFAF